MSAPSPKAAVTRLNEASPDRVTIIGDADAAEIYQLLSGSTASRPHVQFPERLISFAGLWLFVLFVINAYLATMHQSLLGWQSFLVAFALTVFTSNPINLPFQRTAALRKRAVDLAISTVLLLFLLPLLLFIGLAIAADSKGPIFFKQRRVGYLGKPFYVWKFRTMRVDPEPEASPAFASRGDWRVTRLGRFLRETSLDELPQLINVMRGEMSLIGPRPHAIGVTFQGQSLSDLLGNDSDRLIAKPGITGWAQVNGFRGSVDSLADLRKSVGLDIEYAKRQSALFDLWILLRAALHVVHAKSSAY